MNIRKIKSQLCYAVQRVILRQNRPYLLGMLITDHCNLSCSYCKSSGRFSFSFDAAELALRHGYARGHRALYFTGGEPMIWRDGERGFAELVEVAKAIGFFDIFIFTNGTMPLSINGCSYIVTIDGPQAIHNRLRANTYDLVIENVRRAAAQRIFASITLTQANSSYLERYVKEIVALKIFRGISFNCLTGSPDLLAEQGFVGEERVKILDEIWRLKLAGYPIVLSKATYHALRNNDWKRPIREIELASPDRVFTCCRDIENPQVCVNCGYANCVEVSQILALKPSALLQVLKMVG